MKSIHCLFYLVAIVTSLRASEPTVSQLARSLQEESATASADAAEALGKMGPAAAPALAQLVQALGDERETPRVSYGSYGFPTPLTVSKVATDAIIAIGEPAVPFLVEELKRRRRPTRRIIIDVLGEIRSPARAALPELENVVNSTTRDEVRRSAASSYL